MPNFYARTLDEGTRSTVQGQTSTQLGELGTRSAGQIQFTEAAVNVDASRLDRVLPQSVTLTSGSLKAQGQGGPVRTRPRYQIIAGANFGLPGFPTNNRRRLRRV